MARRFRWPNLATAASVYPMPTAAVLLNEDVRFSLFNRQANGVGSFQPG